MIMHKRNHGKGIREQTTTCNLPLGSFQVTQGLLGVQNQPQNYQTLTMYKIIRKGSALFFDITGLGKCLFTLLKRASHLVSRGNSTSEAQKLYFAVTRKKSVKKLLSFLHVVEGIVKFAEEAICRTQAP